MHVPHCVLQPFSHQVSANIRLRLADTPRSTRQTLAPIQSWPCMCPTVSCSPFRTKFRQSPQALPHTPHLPRHISGSRFLPKLPHLSSWVLPLPTPHSIFRQPNCFEANCCCALPRRLFSVRMRCMSHGHRCTPLSVQAPPPSLPTEMQHAKLRAQPSLLSKTTRCGSQKTL